MNHSFIQLQSLYWSVLIIAYLHQENLLRLRSPNTFLLTACPHLLKGRIFLSPKKSQSHSETYSWSTFMTRQSLMASPSTSTLRAVGVPGEVSLLASMSRRSSETVSKCARRRSMHSEMKFSWKTSTLACNWGPKFVFTSFNKLMALKAISSPLLVTT